MQNVRGWNPSVELLPGYLAALTATQQHLSPQPLKPTPEELQPTQVSRHRVVSVITQSDLLQPFTHDRNRLVPTADQLSLNRLQLRHHPLLRRLPPYDKGPIAPLPRTVMCETQEREGLRLSQTPLFPVVSGEPPKLDQPCLFRM
jgi:hypothetical protein